MTIAGVDALKGYYVCRQWYYYTGELMVEITEGGLDYAGPDHLSEMYPGEGKAYKKPQSAALAAIKIRDRWQKDEPDNKVHICVRSQLAGYFGEEGDPISVGNLARWARETWANLPKCARCGDVLPEEKWGNVYTVFEGEYPYCSENCAENDYVDMFEENWEGEDD